MANQACRPPDREELMLSAGTEALTAWMREWEWITDTAGCQLPGDYLRRVCEGATRVVLEAITDLLLEDWDG